MIFHIRALITKCTKLYDARILNDAGEEHFAHFHTLNRFIVTLMFLTENNFSNTSIFRNDKYPIHTRVMRRQFNQFVNSFRKVNGNYINFTRYLKYDGIFHS